MTFTFTMSVKFTPFSGTQLKVRSHLALTSKFASIFASDSNIVSVMTLMLTQKMGTEPIFVCVFLLLLISKT